MHSVHISPDDVWWIDHLCSDLCERLRNAITLYPSSPIIHHLNIAFLTLNSDRSDWCHIHIHCDRIQTPKTLRLTKYRVLFVPVDCRFADHILIGAEMLYLAVSIGRICYVLHSLPQRPLDYFHFLRANFTASFLQIQVLTLSIWPPPDRKDQIQCGMRYCDSVCLRIPDYFELFWF